MRKVFIVIDESTLQQDKNLKRKIANLYADIYSAPPWNETWTTESALSELEEVMVKSGFLGVLSTDNEALTGFSWGYNIPNSNTTRVDFEKIRRELLAKGITPDEVFYGAETGVKAEYRQQGLAGLLVQKRAEESGKDCFVIRTKNPAILRVWKRTMGDYQFSFLEESSYEGGRAYVYK